MTANPMQVIVSKKGKRELFVDTGVTVGHAMMT